MPDQIVFLSSIFLTTGSVVAMFRHPFIPILACLLMITGVVPLQAGDTNDQRLLNPQQIPFDRQLPGAKEPFVERTGGVLLNLSSMMQMPELQDRNRLTKTKNTLADQQKPIMEIALFPDTMYRVIVESVSHEDNGTTTWNGHLENGDGSFTLITAPDGYILTLKDGNKLYRSAGDAKSGKGLVREIDLDKIPPSYDEAPDIDSSGNRP